MFRKRKRQPEPSQRQPEPSQISEPLELLHIHHLANGDAFYEYTLKQYEYWVTHESTYMLVGLVPLNYPPSTIGLDRPISVTYRPDLNEYDKLHEIQLPRNWIVTITSRP